MKCEDGWFVAKGNFCAYWSLLTDVLSILDSRQTLSFILINTKYITIETTKEHALDSLSYFFIHNYLSCPKEDMNAFSLADYYLLLRFSLCGDSSI